MIGNLCSKAVHSIVVRVVAVLSTLNTVTLYQILKGIWQIVSIENSNKSMISSKPYQLCFCDGDHISECSTVRNIEVYRGEEFTVPLIALAQGNATVSTQVTAKIQKTASLQLDQSIQSLYQHCSNKTFNLYSRVAVEELVLYVDGPCRDTGVATVHLMVNLRPCPDAFHLSGDRCECETRLQAYDAECTIHSEQRKGKPLNQFYFG